ncbi:hypothetical protein BDZ89DRAFT_1009202 [Hymenopellis radicata]|nr:hypothetical protein BDZ89DRAFT_1009202 [Hymenopellis radicata]
MPPRRSSRILAASPMTLQSKPKAAAKKHGKTGAAMSPSPDLDEDDDDYTTTSTPARKKYRKRVKTNAPVASAAANPRIQRGILQQLTETPLDVLLEIFSYLEPLDLLRMSRTTKALRSLLMGKSSSSVWERARLRMKGLPPMLDGMSEPEYANLLFDSHCHNCAKGNTKYVQWQIRMRLCRECLDGGTIMVSQHVLRNDYKDRLVPPPEELLRITPSFTHSRRTVFLQFYDRDSYDSLVEESEALTQGTPEYDAWFLKRKKEYTALARECTQYEKWMESRTAERAAELATLRHERLLSVIAHLTEDGWGDEVKDNTAVGILKEHALVNQPKELTERDWEAIKPKLTELMEDLRIDILQQQIQDVARERVKLLQQLGNALLAKLPETPPNPSASTLCTFQPFVDIIKDTPIDHDVTVQFTEGLKNLPALCADWREKQEVHLKQMLRKAGRSDDLSLAANAFTCKNCSGSRYRMWPVLHYPYFASHHCFSSCTRVGYAEVDVLADKQIKVVIEDSHEACKEVIRFCGLDPATATAHDMDDANAFLACEKCVNSFNGDRSRPQVLMRWRTAMNHQWHVESLFRVTDPELISLAQRAEKSSLKPVLASDLLLRPYWTRRNPPAFVCVHCNVADSTPSAWSEHLRSAHAITGAFEDHYRLSLKDSALNSAEIRPKYAMLGSADGVASGSS